jgi:hypothetical protein
MSEVLGEYVKSWVLSMPLAPFRDPWVAKSRTCAEGRDKSFFYCMTYPFMTYVYLGVVPVLWPVMVSLSAVYGINAIRTLEFQPVWIRPKDSFRSNVTYIAYQRRYDEVLKRPTDICLERPSDISHALSVVGEKRQQYISDPADPTIQYYVMAQHYLDPNIIFGFQFHCIRITYDILAFLLPMYLASRMRPASKLMMTDLKLIYEGRLSIFSIRSPLFTWFRSVTEKNKEDLRVVTTTKKPLKYPVKPSLKNVDERSRT